MGLLVEVADFALVDVVQVVSSAVLRLVGPLQLFDLLLAEVLEVDRSPLAITVQEVLLLNQSLTRSFEWAS